MTEELYGEATRRVELLGLVSKLADEAFKAEGALLSARKELDAQKASTNYWLTEYNKVCARVKELEQRINELSSPLAELARASKE